MLPSADPTCTEWAVGWDNSWGRVKHLPHLPTLPSQTYRDSEQGRGCRVLPPVLGMMALSNLFVSHFFIPCP